MNKLLYIIVLFGFLLVGCGPAFNDGKIIGKDYVPFGMVWISTGYSGFLKNNPESWHIIYQGEYNKITSAEVDKDTFDNLQVGGYFSYSRYKADK